MSDRIRVLSGGAVRVGITGCADAFSRQSGCAVDFDFATAPEMREKVEAGADGADVYIATLAAQEAFAASGRSVAGSAVAVGSVRAGIVVHRDAPDPDIATPEALAETLRRADVVVLNTASSGLAIERVLDGLGLMAELAGKIERPATGSAVMEAVGGRPGAAVIGFGQSTEIRRLEHLGVRRAGYLPPGAAVVTSYSATLSSAAPAPDAARAFLGFLAGDTAADLLRAAGVE